MTKKRRTRRALINSVISLLICFSMLLGTTFAWFTDEVKTGMNTIQAGNLDVELLANGTKVDSDTELFDDVKLWEPGVVAYENLQVSNVGTLALKYQMSLNFGNENDLNGHKLSEVLKVVKLDQTIDESTMTRAQVLEKAKEALANMNEQGKGKGTLSNFYLTGELEAKTDGPAFAVVVFWEPNANEIDNLYNVNNGQLASDGKDYLYIDLGVNLQATQKMSEKDSFGNDYDEFATILPKATVNNLGAIKVLATTNDMGTNATPTEYNLNTAYQFLPNETYEEAQSSAYRYYHADYVISADQDVPANSMALTGYYRAFCDDYNNKNWVALTADETIKAGTEIRLVDSLGDGISVNYQELCNYGNDGIGFKCGVADLTGVNAGTTITVELRLYETTGDPTTTTGPKNEETGDYEVVGKYTYTFPGAAEYVEDAAEFSSVLSDAEPGMSIYMAPDVDYGTIDINSTLKDVTIVAGEDSTAFIEILDGSELDNVVFKDFNLNAYNGPSSYAGAINVHAGAKADIKFENCSFAPNSGYAGVRVYEPTAKLSFADCNFTGGRYAVYDSGAPIAKAEFIDCEFSGQSSWVIQFNGSGTDSVITIDGCTFDGVNGGIIKVLGAPTEGSTFTFTNNTIINSQGHDGKEAEWFSISSAYAITCSGNTLDGAEWNPTSIQGLGK